MDPFLALRHQAAVKRDEAVAHARRVYRTDIEAIEKLERALPKYTPMKADSSFKKAPNTYELIKTLVPPDKPFTLTDVLQWLYDATKGQKFREQTVRTYVSRLASQGIIRKLHRTSTNAALWVSTGSKVEEGGIETMALPDIVELILSEERRPLRLVEIAVCMHSRGYRQKTTPKTLMRAIRDMFKRCPGRFVRGEDGRFCKA